MTKKSLKVEGMSCAHCEMSVREELESLSGVRSADADHGRGTVEVVFEGEVTDEELRLAIEEAGYRLVRE